MRNHSFLPGRSPWIGLLTLVLFAWVQYGSIQAHTSENYSIHVLLTCDNVTDGGSIQGDETGCPDPVFDPSEIVNVILPSGGSGDLEYIWMYTTIDPSLPITSWQTLPNSNSPSYDPGPITTTTWYRRCSRRSGCTEYTGETGYVTKEVKCCENVDNPGTIGYDQKSCTDPYDPSTLVNVTFPSGGTGNLIYNWYISLSGPPYDPATWTIIPGAEQATYDPGPLTTTTWFLRAVRREDCSEFLFSNPVIIQVLDAPEVSGVVTDVDCHGLATGSIDLSVTGGTPGYSFDWDTAPDLEDPMNLEAGTYSVTVTDQKGCSATSSFEVEEPAQLAIAGSVIHPTCYGLSTGAIDLTASGGTPGYSYLWSTGETTADLDGLDGGIYSVTVTDQNGCSVTEGYAVHVPPVLLVSLTKTDVSCAGSADGRIELVVQGGTMPYSFLWSNGENTKDIENLAGGPYVVTVTDDQGCSIVKNADVFEPAPLFLSMTGTDPLCTGGTDGSAEVSVTGGTAPYSYVWDDLGQHTTALCSDLGMGTYHVTVSDLHGCSAVGQVTLEDGLEDCEINIGDFVWLDSDRDGIQDQNEYGQNGILVKLVQTGPDGDYGTADDTVIDSVYTSGFGFNTGYYLFTDVQPGTYSICFVLDTSAFQFTLMDEGADDAVDSDPHPGTGCVEEFTILPNAMDDLTFDAGFHARCVNVISGGTIGYDEVLCEPGADPAEIINLIFPAGGLGQLEYLWLRSDTDPMYYPGNPEWEAIPNSNFPDFDPLPIEKTTYYIRCARREGCWDYPGETNIVTKAISDPVAEITGPAGPLCVDEGYFFMATSNGPNATYDWDFGPYGNPQTASGLVVNNVSWNESGLQTVTLTVTLEGCSASTSVLIETEECGGKHEIQSFSAYVNLDLDVDLSWYSSAYPSDHVYLVERSIDGKDFQYVATIFGKAHQDLWFAYRDDHPVWGENYYRIRMVTDQGVVATSEPQRVVVKETNMFNVSVFPNPMSTQLEVRLLEAATNPAEIKFYDLLGREIHSEKIAVGTKSQFINCQDWPDGLVIAWVMQDGKRPFSIPLQKINE